jgi:hypothetical protein
LKDPYVGCPQCRAEVPGADAILHGEVADE